MKTLITCALLALSATAQASSSTIFSDNFEASPTGLNLAPAGWSVSGGSLDVISAPDWMLCGGTGNCIDLDGTTFQAGMLSRTLTLTSGSIYTLSFDMAGNRRGAQTHGVAQSEQVQVGFGSSSTVLSFGLSHEGTAWTNHSLRFAPLTTGEYTLSFLNLGSSDNRGALLDNLLVTRSDVSVSPVPEPGSYALMLAGLLTIGSLARRRAGR